MSDELPDPEGVLDLLDRLAELAKTLKPPIDAPYFFVPPTKKETFPSPWSRDELVFTRWPGPVTVRYRSIVCRARGTRTSDGGNNIYGWEVTPWVWKCWQADDPELAESLGLPRRSKEVGNNPPLGSHFDLVTLDDVVDRGADSCYLEQHPLTRR